MSAEHNGDVTRLPESAVTSPAADAAAATDGSSALWLQPRTPDTSGWERDLTLVPQPLPMPRTSRQWASPQHAQHFVQALMEVLGGDRPVHQVFRWTNTAVYLALVELAKVGAAAADGADRGTSPVAARTRRSPCQVASVKVFTPRSGVAEV
ncbi:MAG: Rv3235 family protein, partial [Pseudonocardiaceae bacterium]